MWRQRAPRRHRRFQRGKVVDVVCYPANSSPPVIEEKGDVTLGQNENKAVVAIDGAADGVDIAGNVTSAGNNVVVYGEGPAVSVIGGTSPRRATTSRCAASPSKATWRSAAATTPRWSSASSTATLDVAPDGDVDAVVERLERLERSDVLGFETCEARIRGSFDGTIDGSFDGNA